MANFSENRAPSYRKHSKCDIHWNIHNWKSVAKLLERELQLHDSTMEDVEK